MTTHNVSGDTEDMIDRETGGSDETYLHDYECDGERRMWPADPDSQWISCGFKGVVTLDVDGDEAVGVCPQCESSIWVDVSDRFDDPDTAYEMQRDFVIENALGGYDG